MKPTWKHCAIAYLIVNFTIIIGLYVYRSFMIWDIYSQTIILIMTLNKSSNHYIKHEDGKRLQSTSYTDASLIINTQVIISTSTLNYILGVRWQHLASSSLFYIGNSSLVCALLLRLAGVVCIIVVVILTIL